MGNPMIEKKKELIEWINHLKDLVLIQQMVDLKNSQASSLISDINSETIIENDFDEQFAAGMTSDELLENIAEHIESIAEEEPSSVVSDTQSEYAVKDDFDERFAKGLTPEKAREESKKKIREWWGK